MPQLTDTQLILLSKAAQAEGHVVTLPDRLKGGAANKVVGKLLDLQFVEEFPAGRDMPVWRHDDDDRPLALRATDAGLEAIGITEAGQPSTGGRKSTKGTRRPANVQAAGSRKSGSTVKGRQGPSVNASPRRSSKQDAVIALLQRKSGATIVELTDATGWLPHSARAVLSGLRKRGFVIDTDRSGKTGTRYRIIETPANDGPESARKSG
ncbi:DUF3489 domain-containing protein [Microbaculum sp. FT89]|uniref:DUF3489 domain-containing protein n=1 Tax=Microbaculum sp. FT89 TaxID=3447298 RepID=UPI003F52CE23